MKLIKKIFSKKVIITLTIYLLCLCTALVSLIFISLKTNNDNSEMDKEYEYSNSTSLKWSYYYQAGCIYVISHVGSMTTVVLTKKGEQITHGPIAFGSALGSPWTIQFDIPQGANPETWKPSMEEIKKIREVYIKDNPELSSYTLEDLANKYVSLKEYWESGEDSLPMGDFHVPKQISK